MADSPIKFDKSGEQEMDFEEEDFPLLREYESPAVRAIVGSIERQLQEEYLQGFRRND